MLHNLSNYEILLELNSQVAGHESAKKALINLVNRSKIRHHQKWIEQMHKDYLIAPHKLLLIGQSGTGKTHMIEKLQEIVDFPLIRLDATKLNPTGASGGSKEEDVRKMIIEKAAEYCQVKKGYYHSMEGTIDQVVVFVDEIDKLGKRSDSSGNWNTHVQANFLTLFDNKAEFAGVSFIFAGAFADMTKYDKGDIGEKVVQEGLIPELVGRFTSIIELDKFGISDYYDILTQRLIPKKLIDLAFFGVFDSNIPEERLQEMCVIAHKSGQGVRSLQRQLDKEYLDSEFDSEYKSRSSSTKLIKSE